MIEISEATHLGTAWGLLLHRRAKHGSLGRIECLHPPDISRQLRCRGQRLKKRVVLWRRNNFTRSAIQH